MKTYQQLSLSLALAGLVAVFGIGCSNNKTKDPVPAETQNVGGGGTNPLFLDSKSVAFQPTSIDTFSNYVAIHPINNPTQFILKVNLEDIGSGRYAGDLQISYYDNGQTFTGTFVTGDGTVAPKANPYYGLSHAEFNKWFYYNGQQVFHAFFQDSYGAIVLVIDDGLDLGDGAGMSEASGSIWFKNFNGSRYPQYEEPCWFLLVGPYMCPTFLTGGRVSTASALYPSDGFKKLGTFEGLNVSEAFNR